MYQRGIYILWTKVLIDYLRLMKGFKCLGGITTCICKNDLCSSRVFLEKLCNIINIIVDDHPTVIDGGMLCNLGSGQY